MQPLISLRCARVVWENALSQRHPRPGGAAHPKSLGTSGQRLQPKPCTGRLNVTAESRPPVVPGQPCPQGRAGAQTPSWDTQVDQRRRQAARWGPIPLPPSALLRWPREVFLGSFPSAAPAKTCLFTWSQTFNEAPSVAGIIILCSRNCPHYLLLIRDGVFPAQRITISNPSPDPARGSAGVVRKGLQRLGLNIAP